MRKYKKNKAIRGIYKKSESAVCENGIFVGRKEGDVLTFKGIPYALPPVGDLRWKNPVPAPGSRKVYRAFYYGKSPLQTEWPSEAGSLYVKGEDCLTLNIWTNTTGPEKGRPVMVFFHGGSYGWGATCDPIYDGYGMVNKFPDLVLVTVEYRVGIMGFIDFSRVPGGEEYQTSGNLGLLDQLCALKWIQKNIAAFGGDPGNVTIFGESAGAGSVSLLPLMRGSKGLFRRIIAESGSVALTYSRKECLNLTSLLLKESGCRTMAELTALSEAELTRLNEELNDYNNFPERDNVVLPEDLYGAWEDPELAGIDMLIGTNADEVRYWIREMSYSVDKIPFLSGLKIYMNGMFIMLENNLFELSREEKKLVHEFMARLRRKHIWTVTEYFNEMLFRIPAMEQAARHAAAGGKSYTYYWTQRGANETIGASHAIELSYIFNNPEEVIYTGNVYNEELADKVQRMWVNFARTGDPSLEDLRWRPYEPDTRLTMILGKKTGMVRDLKREQRLLLEPMLGHYFNGCYSQMSYFVPHTLRMGAAALGGIATAAAGYYGLFTLLFKYRKR
ncbi:MAG: carboxylesterase family protein [Lachnospiraceae bacterium]|nr:carboxylesterase family protein [Lachnospiraceae bacterium]